MHEYRTEEHGIQDLMICEGAANYDIEERLIAFACEIIDITEQLPNTMAGKHIAGQLVRSGTSPAPNYGEAQSAESRRDFIHKMKICLKELRESRVWLMIILAKRMGRELDKTKAARVECEELIRIFAKSIHTARENDRRDSGT